MVVSYSFFYCKIFSKFTVEEIKRFGAKRSTITFKKDLKRRDFISTDRKYCIGHTTNFVFIYDEDLDRATAYPMSDVSSITS